MKILQASNFFKPIWEAGGVARVAYSLSKNLVLRGHEVTVYTTNKRTKPVNYPKNHAVETEGMTIYYFENYLQFNPIKTFPTPFNCFFKIRKEIRTYDIIHIHEHRTLFAVIISIYAKKYGIPYVIQSHGSVLPDFPEKVWKKIFDHIIGFSILRNASLLIAVSNAEVEQYRQMNAGLSKIALLPNGIDSSQYENTSPKSKFKAKLGITDGNKFILYLGRLEKRKRIDLLIQSFAMLKEDINQLYLVISGPDKGISGDLITICKRFKIYERTIFTGVLTEDEKIASYSEAEMLVYPGEREIFGLSQFEAILCDTPVIVSNDSGCGEIISSANCGFLFEVNDAKDLAQTIKFVLINPEEAKRRVDAGKKYIAMNMDWRNITLRLEQIYQECINNSKGYSVKLQEYH